MKTVKIASALLLLSLAGTALCAVYNAPCKTDDQCYAMYTTSYVCEKEHCIRKSFDYNHLEIIGIIFIVFISMIANAGGLGAGAVIIPVYIFIYNFSPTDSIPLSKITIFAGALVNFILSWRERDHRRHNKFLINYNMGAVIIPLLLAGTQIGVILSKFLPPFVIILGLIFYLLLSLTKMYERGVKEVSKENKERAELLEQKLANSEAATDVTEKDSTTPTSKSTEQKKGSSAQAGKKKKSEASPGTEISDRPKKIIKQKVIHPETQEEMEIEVETHDFNDPDDDQIDEEFCDNDIDGLNEPPSETVESGKDVTSGQFEVTKQVEDEHHHEHLPTLIMMNRQIINFFYMILSLGNILMTAMIRGGEGSKSIIGLDKCSAESMFLFVLSQVFSVLICYKAYKHNVHILDEDDHHHHAEVDRSQFVTK